MTLKETQKDLLASVFSSVAERIYPKGDPRRSDFLRDAGLIAALYLDDSVKATKKLFNEQVIGDDLIVDLPPTEDFEDQQDWFRAAEKAGKALAENDMRRKMRKALRKI